MNKYNIGDIFEYIDDKTIQVQITGMIPNFPLDVYRTKIISGQYSGIIADYEEEYLDLILKLIKPYNLPNGTTVKRSDEAIIHKRAGYSYGMDFASDPPSCTHSKTIKRTFQTFAFIQCIACKKDLGDAC